MTNYEANKNELEKLLLENGEASFGVIGNEVHACSSINCKDCLFYRSSCHIKLRKEWLNAEHNPYTIPVDTPVDTKVLVSMDGKYWRKEYFAQFSNMEMDCPYACFGGGATSWSCSGAWDISTWRFCKLYEEED